MSFGPCEIVKIVADNDSGYVVINASDYDAEKHALYEGVSAPDFVPHESQADAWASPAVEVAPEPEAEPKPKARK